ncbi:hypothetical protein BCR41DRAFT_372730 [Lobosporangium transversale]|uniref:Uncharacterized protein n=1 Tax=Lobosporangium transversale TaxID=64571 RepID=A0A1Y2GFU4_9FUNG|nr:hypothetical protein BCR41DRAFT_372730 [Lobosporangium transversale]ORZ09701.1 hypothetical protein BCR41DRAFT_372730 [Lobosporangium transversale]|eukprot:XP_021878971.1 hypothetical protein BCR41DRAFT_372730 [Lobosporangium transversale]
MPSLSPSPEEFKVPSREFVSPSKNEWPLDESTATLEAGEMGSCAALVPGPRACIDEVLANVLTGGLLVNILEALLELRVLRIECSSYMRWIRESPRGVRPLEAILGGCIPGDRVVDRVTRLELPRAAAPLRDIGLSIRGALMWLSSPFRPALLSASELVTTVLDVSPVSGSDKGDTLWAGWAPGEVFDSSALPSSLPGFGFVLL